MQAVSLSNVECAFHVRCRFVAVRVPRGGSVAVPAEFGSAQKQDVAGEPEGDSRLTEHHAHPLQIDALSLLFSFS